MNLPNKLTISRIFCTPLLILFYMLPIPYGIGKFIALAIYILACITDLLDGKIARKYNLVTDFGKFSDQIADKFLTTSALILVLFSGVTYWWLEVLIVLIVVLRDILISGIRMLAAKNGTVIAADIFGKIKSFVLDVALMIMILYIGLNVLLPGQVDFIRIIGLVGVVAGGVLALVSCINYLKNSWQVIKDSLKDK
ncbi:MAG: CDP-diacylglycerol--glycerol-3-phosphate 3-phosphatidyltransferase [bacterium]|nr:CDP-diacylglycerol--glycerol-3-phosphate 3-phosphatidyltransferase [bacterium]